MADAKEYQVVNGYDALTRRHSSEALTAKVNRLIAEGWFPKGGVSAYVDPFTSAAILLQAMVR